MRIHTLLCLPILVALSLNCLGQDTGSIAFTLTDGRGERIADIGPSGANAHLYLTKMPTRTFTGRNDQILVEDLEPGKYLAVVVAGGFEDWAIVGVEVEPAQTTTVEAGLRKGETGKVFTFGRLGKTKKEDMAELLQAMAEPALCSEEHVGKGDSYRFLWLRAFHNPILVGLNITGNGMAELSVKEVDGRGGYEPGKLVTNETRRLPDDTLEWFLPFVEETKFWQLPTRVEHTHLIGLDGADWLIEGVRNGDCHVVIRWSPKKGDYFRALGEAFLFSLADMKLMYGDVY